MVKDPIVLRFIEKHAEDVGRMLEIAEPNEMQAFISILSVDQAASIINHLGKRSACEYLAGLETNQAIEIIKALPVQSAAALVRDMPLTARKAILASDETPNRIKTTLRFPKGSVGSEMDSNPITLNEGMTVKQAKAFLKKHQEHISDPLFVTGSEQQFAGVIALKDLLFADNPIKVSFLCTPPIHKLSPRDALALAADYLARQQVSVLPVIERGGRLAGVLNRKSLPEILAGIPENEATATDISDSIISLGELFWSTCADMLPDYDASNRPG